MKLSTLIDARFPQDVLNVCRNNLCSLTGATTCNVGRYGGLRWDVAQQSAAVK